MAEAKHMQVHILHCTTSSTLNQHYVAKCGRSHVHNLIYEYRNNNVMIVNDLSATKLDGDNGSRRYEYSDLKSPQSSTFDQSLFFHDTSTRTLGQVASLVE